MSNEELVIQIQNGDTGAKTKLWEQIYKWVLVICRKYLHYAMSKTYELDDLINSVWFALDKAVSSYNADMGNKFITYFTFYAEREIKRFLELTKAVKTVVISLDEPIETSEGEGVTRLDLVEDETAVQQFDEVLDRCISYLLKKQLNKLSDTEKFVIISTYYRGFTLKETGERLNISASRTDSIKGRALIKLRMQIDISTYYDIIK